ncbi:MAG TPA: hypothetical protein DEF47_18695 [Herpetosiphon sp.]|uniref:Uncharacterized protein n=1 Tax=Herpetosiphon aurantiacus (strain ATCC 23779 / DSM 785 / 114-95) TaxID=316274 RepID=A9B5T4_HERA2|nr:hypothetical protein [Herpetosiphon sp.]ABX04317.1 conserved hypothetical protein [Herpetosiphon aurantiacus DSM 785]HBW51921.1 hypothetical protein [Herpetosiphon sp.]
MPRSLVIERENLPTVVQGWLDAIGLEHHDTVELVFTEGELVLRKPLSPELRAWAKGVVDAYDREFQSLIGL